MRVKTYLAHIDKEIFNSQDNQHCILPISVGQPYHEDKKFESTLNLMNRTFKKCTILVCDTLQRYSNFVIFSDRTFEEVAEYSLQAGEQWIQKNQQFIDKLTIPHEVQRWDQWLNHAEFDAYHQHIHNLYLEDADFKKELDEAASTYAERLFLRDNNCDRDKARKMSILYLKEECAIFFLAMKTGNINYFIYPTIINLLEVLFKKLEYNNWSHRCFCHGLNFKKSKPVA